MSLILRCPKCAHNYEGAANSISAETLTCPQCGATTAAGDFSAMMFCPHCRSKLAVALDMVQDSQLLCPQCNQEFTPSMVISLDDDDDDDELFAAEDIDKPMLNPGDFFDKYEIIRLLGKGGMGEVYLARHLFLNRDVALKIMLPEVAAQNSIFSKRFIREAKLASKIASPNLISVFDVGSDSKTESLFIAMEYIEGYNVSEIIKSTGALSEDDTLTIISEVLNALEAIGEHNVVHRDIKPSNIMIDANGIIKLADLGIAKSSNHAEGELTLTHGSAVFGTPNYASPEQCRSAHNVDCRADIYSLGATMYHMVTGKPPYDGETAFEIMLKVFNDPLPDLRDSNADLSPAFITLVTEMMAKEPEKRPQTIAELKKRIDTIRSGEYKFSDRIRDIVKLKKTFLHNEKTAYINKKNSPGWNLLKTLISLALVAAVGIGAFIFGIRIRDKYKLAESKEANMEVYTPPLKRKKITPRHPENTNFQPSVNTAFRFKTDRAGKHLMAVPYNLSSYEIDDNIVSIGEGAFRNCKFLKKITMPAGLKRIENEAFANCSNLLEINIPANVKYIASGAFANCSALHTVNFPKGMKLINANIFLNCHNLKRINIAADAVIIGDSRLLQDKIFRYEEEKKPVITQPKLQELDENALTENIQVHDLPKIEEDKTKGFKFSSDNKTLTEVPKNVSEYEIPRGITSIGYKAFFGCLLIKNIIIPDSLKNIASFAFYQCNQLKHINIPDSVEYIAPNAFSFCSGLETITIGKGLKSIDAKVFFKCMNLKKIIAPNGLKITGQNSDLMQQIVVTDAQTPVPENILKQLHASNTRPTLQAVDYNKLASNSYSENSIVQYPATINGRLEKFTADLKDMYAQQKKTPYNKWLKERITFYESVKKNLIRQQNIQKTSLRLKQTRKYNAADTKKIQDLFYQHSIKRRDWGYSRDDINFAEQLLQMIKKSNADPNMEVQDGTYARLSGSLLKNMLEGRGMPTSVTNKIVDELLKRHVVINLNESTNSRATSKTLALRKNILEYGVDDLNGFMLKAVKNVQHKDLINVLLKCGANVNEKDADGNSVLHYALRFNDIEIIRNLLLAGADVTAVNNEQQTPLFYANKYSSKQIINLLIAAGSDVKFKDLHNKTAGDYKHFGDFNIAIHKNHIYSVSTMLRKFPELANCVLSDDLTPLQYAAKNKNLALVKILLNAKADPNKKGTSDYRSYTPLQFVYDFPYFYSPNNLNERTKKFNIFKELLKAGANINVNPMGHGGNRSLLHFSLGYCYRTDNLHFNYISEMLKYYDVKNEMSSLLSSLFRHRYNFNYSSGDPRDFSEQIFKMLMSHKVDLSSSEYDRIFYNAAINFTIPDRMIELLLKNKCNVNATINGYTALFHLCQTVHREDIMPKCISRVKLLIRNGADVAITCRGKTLADIKLTPEIRKIPEIRNFISKHKR